jgi:serine protease Do
VATRLINDGKISRGYIGAALQPVSPDLVDSLKLPKDVSGALVANVAEDGPAEKSGLEPGDVVTAIDGSALKGVSDLVNQIGLKNPGTKITLTYYRNGNKEDVTVKLDKWPESRDDNGQPRLLGQKQEKAGPFGLAVVPYSKDLARRFNLENKSGVIVTSVGENSPAERAGLQPGDMILSVNRKKISSPKQFKEQTEKEKKLLLRIERGGQYFFATINKGDRSS